MPGGGRCCAVIGCYNNQRKLRKWRNSICDEHAIEHHECPCLEPFTFRYFPANNDKKMAWVAALQRKDFIPKRDSVVCSLHFIDGRPTEKNPTPQLAMGSAKQVGYLKARTGWDFDGHISHVARFSPSRNCNRQRLLSPKTNSPEKKRKSNEDEVLEQEDQIQPPCQKMLPLLPKTNNPEKKRKSNEDKVQELKDQIQLPCEKMLPANPSHCTCACHENQLGSHSRASKATQTGNEALHDHGGYSTPVKLLPKVAAVKPNCSTEHSGTDNEKLEERLKYLEEENDHLKQENVFLQEMLREIQVVKFEKV